MTKDPKIVVAPEAQRDPALGIDAAGGPGALPYGDASLPHAEEDERGDELAAEDWLADPAQNDILYRVDRAEVPEDGFVVVMVRHTADHQLPSGATERSIFRTEAEAQADADRRNNAAD